MKSPENQPPRGMTLEATFGDGKRPTPASRRGDRNGDQGSSGLSDYLAWPGRICLLLAVVISPWIFASVNFDAQRWIAISLLLGLGFWWFETSMNSQRKQVLPVLFFPLLLGILLGLFQLIPLPESAASLLGRQIEIQQQFAGVPAGANVSISVNREGTWHHLRLLTIALTALLLGSRYFRTKQEISILLTTMAANGAAISFFGIIHTFTSNGKMFWFHEVVLGGHHFGPFVNRNNACGYLLICLAAAVGLLPILLARSEQSAPQTMVSREHSFWRQLLIHLVDFFADLNAKKIAALLAIVLIGTGIIVSLSRGGTLAMLFGGMVSLVAYGMARQPKNSLFLFVPILLLAGLMIGFWTLGDGLIQRIQKVDTVELDNDLRIQQWQATWPATKQFGILGSGLGTYLGVHRAYRTTPETVVFHYAENQYYQSLVEAGWPGLVIFLTAWVLAFLSARLLLNRGQSHTSIGVGLMGVFLISSQAIASALDFGFYIPANTLGLAVMFGFLCYHAQALGGRLKKPSWLRLQVSSVVIRGIMLVLFGSTCLVAYELHQRATIQQLSRPRYAQLTRQNMTLAQSKERLDQLLPLVKNCPTPKGLDYAAGLLIHNCRLQIFETMLVDSNIDQIVGVNGQTDEQAKENAATSHWNTTRLVQLQEHVNFLEANSKNELRGFKQQLGIQQNLPLAVDLLNYSRKISPLQPLVHLRIAQLNSIIGNTDEADRSILRTLAITPQNPKFRNIAGIYYLQSNRPQLAAEQFRQQLELQPRDFNNVMKIATGRSNRSTAPISAAVIGNTMLPDDPEMLFKYVTKFPITDANQKRNTLERAANLLENLDQRRQYPQDKLLGDIRRQQNEPEKALAAYNDYLFIVPHDLKYLHKRAVLLEELGKYELALEDANRLSDRSPDPKKFRNYARALRRKLSEQEENDR